MDEVPRVLLSYLTTTVPPLEMKGQRRTLLESDEAAMAELRSTEKIPMTEINGERML